MNLYYPEAKKGDYSPCPECGDCDYEFSVKTSHEYPHRMHLEFAHLPNPDTCTRKICKLRVAITDEDVKDEVKMQGTHRKIKSSIELGEEQFKFLVEQLKRRT